MTPTRILIAGIGNILKGDDGFGVEVARTLAGVDLPSGVAVAEFGIRGVDLAFAITDGCETVILVDAVPSRGNPGQVSVIQPQPADLQDHSTVMQGHSLDPLSVLRWASRLAEALPEIYVVGCETVTLPPDVEFHEGLSSPVRLAVETATTVIQKLVEEVLRSKERGRVGV